MPKDKANVLHGVLPNADKDTDTRLFSYYAGKYSHPSQQKQTEPAAVVDNKKQNADAREHPSNQKMEHTSSG